MSKYQDYETWIRQNSNGSDLECLEEKLKMVDVNLQCAILYPNSFSEERINDFKNQKNYLLTEIYNAKWIKFAYQHNKKK